MRWRRPPFLSCSKDFARSASKRLYWGPNWLELSGMFGLAGIEHLGPQWSKGGACENAANVAIKTTNDLWRAILTKPFVRLALSRHEGVGHFA
jgi:hypothetical protein